MRDDIPLLAEMMLHAELFCAQIETATKKSARCEEQDELLLKIGQCRGALAQLQTHYDEESLTIDNATVCADFRHLVMGLMWVAFRARESVDFKLFRKLVQIESNFTYLLINRNSRANVRKSQ